MVYELNYQKQNHEFPQKVVSFPHEFLLMLILKKASLWKAVEAKKIYTENQSSCAAFLNSTASSSSAPIDIIESSG